MNYRHLFSGLNAKDERVQAGRDRAGNLSFGFVMALIYAWMCIAILFNRADDFIPLVIVSLAGSVFYLIQLIRSGAAYTSPDTKRRPMRAIIGVVTGVLVYWVISTGLEVRDLWGKANHPSLAKIMVEKAVLSLIWITCSIGLLVIIDRINRRRIDKRLEKGVNGG